MRKPAMHDGKIRIKEIVIYPVKSCKGVVVTSAQLDSQSGLAYDRLWTVVDARGAFMSQRRAPKMALVTPSLPSSASEPLELSAPGASTLKVSQVDSGGKRLNVRIWDDRVVAVDQGDEAAQWFSDFLEIPGLRLVRMPRSTSRWCDSKYAPLLGTRTAFSDGFPILLASAASLADLNAKMKSPLPMARFRPNVVLDGDLEAWAEDSWARVRLGAHTFLVAKPCSRCKIPTICQDTGTVGGEKTARVDDGDDEGGGPNQGAEPTTTLKTFRTGKHLGATTPGWDDEVFFGQNLCLLPTLLDRISTPFSTSPPTLVVGDPAMPL
ncbi:hypothetical protein CTAYLR_001277 [Chrysophaeum taylorii]|uniref:MOSC domain-containing protein n=1 Tax=Chrysophaeum taylorii TaxID=2483200 RepID=A0AAD7XL81_9STRA|nr:hypothetical protein CTAYLR_001277 [Chrysophaeum taylorii]